MESFNVDPRIQNWVPVPIKKLFLHKILVFFFLTLRLCYPKIMSMDQDPFFSSADPKHCFYFLI